MSNFKYYSLEKIDKYDAHYNLIFGERSNGKTSAVLEKILKNWVRKGEAGAYVRRYDEEIKGSKGEVVFSSIADERNLVEKYTDGAYQKVVYYNRKWYLAKYDENLDRYVKQGEPFCYAFAINQAEQYKGTSYPTITTICFDEFLTRRMYLVNEFVEFTNLISTIVRQRNNVKIYMLGNTVNKYSPYFDEMGLYNVPKMKKGTIDTYKYGESGLKVAVEYCESGRARGGKKSDVYFAFDNPKLSMITSGEWELPMYPHAPMKIDQRSILDCFFIEFRDTILQGDIVLQNDSLFIFIHKKTTPIKDDNKIIYSMNYSPKFNHALTILSKPRNKMTKKISELFKNNLVYYQNNSIGELVRNYILETEKINFTNI